MTISELIENLKADGVRASKSQIDYAVRTGRIGRVGFDGAGNRKFSRRHIEALRRYVDAPRGRGRPPAHGNAMLETRAKESATINDRGRASVPAIIAHDLAMVRVKLDRLQLRKRELGRGADPIDRRVRQVQIEVEEAELKRSQKVLDRLNEQHLLR